MTPSISSYIYCLCAGNYHKFVNADKNENVSMRIFCRQSKAPHTDPVETFRILSEGIKFYQTLFGCPFPFAKYDIIYCPEYRIGAMENVGAVTFNDIFIKVKD